MGIPHFASLFIRWWTHRSLSVFIAFIIFISLGWKWKWSRSVMSGSLWPQGQLPTRLCHQWDFPGKNTGVGCHFLLQGIFPTQGLNPGLLHCRQTLYPLSHQGSPNVPWSPFLGRAGVGKNTGWVAIPFSRRSSWPRDWTQVSRTVGRRFTIWATREVSLG